MTNKNQLHENADPGIGRSDIRIAVVHGTESLGCLVGGRLLESETEIGHFLSLGLLAVVIAVLAIYLGNRLAGTN